MNAGKDIKQFFKDEPPGLKTNSIRWLQKRIMKKAMELPGDFKNLAEWEAFRKKIRKELPEIIGIPKFPSIKESFIRGRIKVSADVLCERVDVYVDDDYSIPSFVFTPAKPSQNKMPALVWNPGWPEDKWKPAYQKFAVRMAGQGVAVLILDHAPFGETALVITKRYEREDNIPDEMTFVMGMGQVLGISQLALRAAETMRAGEYLRSRTDIDAKRVAVAGLCQGGMDTWLSAALDEGFCAAAAFCSASTFAIHFAEMASYRANADVSPFPFGILNVCDIEHLYAAIAPRPLIVRANLNDNWWPVSGFDTVETLTRKIYKFYKAEERIDFRAEIHEHNLTGPFADALEHFLLEFV